MSLRNHLIKNSGILNHHSLKNYYFYNVGIDENLTITGDTTMTGDLTTNGDIYTYGTLFGITGLTLINHDYSVLGNMAIGLAQPPII